MNRYLELGRPNRLTVERLVDAGAVLASTEKKEVLLPNRYVPEGTKVGDVLEVFVHTDSEDRIVATTEQPKAMLGEAAAMRVVGTTPHGAFVDWGLPKDLFVPRTLQRTPLKEGEVAVVLVEYDERTHRLVGTTKLSGRLRKAKRDDLKRNQAVELLLFDRTEMGFKAVVEGRYEGLLLHSEIFDTAKIGERRTAYVKRIRDDGKIDLLGRPIGKAADTLAADKVMAWLRSHEGRMPLNYKSAPESVQELLGLSRKNFKRALTYLTEKGLVEVKENGTYLKKKRH